MSSLLAGVALGSLKYMLGYALQKGPANITFASVNSASIAPSCLIALLFGATLNFSYTIYQVIGSLLVLGGLFWAVWRVQIVQDKMLWIVFAVTAFIVQTLFLLVTQMHVLILDNCHLWNCVHHELYSEWYVPLIFLTACLMHVAIYAYRERRPPSLLETLWGLLGGVLNGTSAFFFMHGIATAGKLEQAFIFPTFSISLIIACNIWCQYLYNEKIHWRASSLCLLGVFIGS